MLCCFIWYAEILFTVFFTSLAIESKENSDGDAEKDESGVWVLKTVETYQKSKIFMHLITFEDSDAGTKDWLQLKSIAGKESGTTLSLFIWFFDGLGFWKIVGSDSGTTFGLALIGP